MIWILGCKSGRKKGKWEDWQGLWMQQREKGLLTVKIKYHSCHFIRVGKRLVKWEILITITTIIEVMIAWLIISMIHKLCQ